MAIIHKYNLKFVINLLLLMIHNNLCLHFVYVIEDCDKHDSLTNNTRGVQIKEGISNFKVYLRDFQYFCSKYLLVSICRSAKRAPSPFSRFFSRALFV